VKADSKKSNQLEVEVEFALRLIVSQYVLVAEISDYT
jgi:hypothetical protein